MEQNYNNQKSKYLKETKCEENAVSTSCMKTTEEINANQQEEQTSSDNKTTEDGSGDVTARRIHVHTNRTAFLSQDLLVPWHLKGNKDKTKEAASGSTEVPVEKTNQGPVFHRYYHVFQQGELEELCVMGVKVLRSYHDQGNWCVEMEKTDDLFLNRNIAVGK